MKLADSLKAAIKSVPVARALLSPLARAIRKLANARQERGIRIFREACIALSERRSRPIFIKVGANDGITGDPCSDILLGRDNWVGLLIEPVPHCFERLKKNFGDNRRFRLEQVAVGKPGWTRFYFLDPQAAIDIPGLPYYHDQLGSFDSGHIRRHLGESVAQYVRDTEIEVLPLSDVIARSGFERVDLLHIDVEGHDYEVLKTMDFSRHSPIAIFMEQKHLDMESLAEMRSSLRAKGYSMYDCGPDLLALDRRRLEASAP